MTLSCVNHGIYTPQLHFLLSHLGKEKHLLWQTLELLQVSFDIEMQSSDVKYLKPRLLDVYLSVCVCVCAHVYSCGCVCQFIRLPLLHSASQAGGAGGNCGGRELVRAVSLGDVNMAMLSW